MMWKQPRRQSIVPYTDDIKNKRDRKIVSSWAIMHRYAERMEYATDLAYEERPDHEKQPDKNKYYPMCWLCHRPIKDGQGAWSYAKHKLVHKRWCFKIIELWPACTYLEARSCHGTRCPECGKVFYELNYHYKHCSTECYEASRRARKTPEQLLREETKKIIRKYNSTLRQLKEDIGNEG